MPNHFEYWDHLFRTVEASYFEPHEIYKVCSTMSARHDEKKWNEIIVKNQVYNLVSIPFMKMITRHLYVYFGKIVQWLYEVEGLML
jgi:hypothetical protein